MKRTSMTIPDDLEKALEVYLDDVEVPPASAAVLQEALREYLAQRGYLPDAGTLRPERGTEGKTWPRHPLYSGDPTLAERAEEELAGGPGRPSFGER
ncbi:MAG: hypothetical protein WA990_05095 [Rubrobacteraceae bacterium]